MTLAITHWQLGKLRIKTKISKNYAKILLVWGMGGFIRITQRLRKSHESRKTLARTEILRSLLTSTLLIAM